jgi:hypothetical protein
MGLFWYTGEMSFMGLAIVTSELKLKTVNGFLFHDEVVM